MLNPNTISVLAGQPGTGKTYELVRRAVDDLVAYHSVWVVTPTNSSREAIRAIIDQQLASETIVARQEALKTLRYSIGVRTGYSGETRIYLDEASMFPLSSLMALFYQSEAVDDVHYTIVGDLKQLPAIKSSSVMEVLVSNNIDMNIWEWTKQAYEQIGFETMEAPASWRIGTPIDFEALLDNHRLQELGFTGYNEDYLNHVVANAIDRSATNRGEADYSDVILQALADYRLIIAPTHARGKIIDDYVIAKYGDEALVEFPFVRDGKSKKVYHNPRYKDPERLEQEYPFIPTVDYSVNPEDLSLTAYSSVDMAQGVTTNQGVLFFMGDKPIPSGKTQHHYSRNQLYTAVTRGKAEAQLVGRKASFEKMLTILPQSSQERLHYVKAERAVAELFKLLEKQKTEQTFEYIYNLYKKVFTSTDLGNMTAEVVNSNVSSDIYTPDRLRLAFKAYDDDKASALNRPKYRELLYTTYISEVQSGNAKRKRGTGKVQKYLSSLTPAKLAQIKADVNNLSQSVFKNTYGLSKQSVKYNLENN